MAESTIGVVGSGTMGSGIAHVFALAGHPVILVDLRRDLLDRALAGITGNLERQVKKQGITATQKDTALAAIKTAKDCASLSLCS